ncbi:MAG: NAD-dependent epimerase/dehydratase family protein [Nitrospirales bacterium]|nr:NAD-dependent epimerase/dehydratase family protein [Nitrospira sp.]MDR4502351.1 NAD-dependent epimerase/dehydratase family protein [Nitrospirales bacterium]
MITQPRFKTVLVTGGAGYVGSALVPRLLDEGYRVKVLDLYLYGESALREVRAHPHLDEIKGDIRDHQLLARIIPGCDALIHLACISNDPSFELNPELGRSINYEAFRGLVDRACEGGVKRFIYASSSSVYGVKAEEHVTEDLPVEPLTDYSKYKAMCEEILLNEPYDGLERVVIRPATVCGYSPRLRLDLTVNILTNHAVNNRKIMVFGGQQKRPNIHIKDMVEVYVQSLTWPAEKVNGQVFNAGYHNLRVDDIAQMVKQNVGEDVEIVHMETNDHRSYHISSEKIARTLGFTPQHSVQDAIGDLLSAFREGHIPNSFDDSRYFNIKRMQEVQLV